jgi:hypothetical protein
VKIELAYDLLAGTVISHSLQAATTQDKTIGGELVAEIRRGDLLLRKRAPCRLSVLHSLALIGWRRMNATHDSLVKFDRRGRLRYAPEQ